MKNVVVAVSRTNLKDARLLEGPLPELPPSGESALFRVDHFAFTANNVTYGALGEALSYWSFYPTGEADSGCIPVWGFGTVLRSNAPGLTEGDRYFGYWPMASHALLAAGGATPAS